MATPPQLAALHALRTPCRRKPAPGRAAALRELAVARPYGFVQAKLEVGAVNHPLEQEADAVADRVMRMADPQVSLSSDPTLSRKCAACETEEKEKNPLRRRAAGGDMDGAVAPPIVHDVLSSPGRPLDSATRDFMAPRFGADFGDVRIHTDAQAARSAAAVGARAYTVGSNVVFGSSQYRPDQPEGQRLIAHELAHVAQQQPATVRNMPLLRRDVDDESGAEGPSADEPVISADEAEELDLEDAGAATADDASEVDRDDPVAAAAEAEKQDKKDKKDKKKSGKSDACAGDCPQGRQPKIIHDDCGESKAVDKTNFITNLDVDVGAGKLTVTWSNNKTETWPCTGNPSATPKTTTEVVGVKCSKHHTNAKKTKDGMAWFTGFKSTGMRIGFHDSQPVGPGLVSHGCVRVCCDKAKLINKNSSSGVTKITVV